MSKVNPKEAPKGYYATADNVKGGDCDGCAFFAKGFLTCTRSERVRDDNGCCVAENRIDSTSVIFKKGKVPVKTKKAKTELRWAKRMVTEEQWFLVEVTKGASEDKIIEACLEGDALYGTPHDTVTKQSDTDIEDFEEADPTKYGKPIDLVEETK